MAFIKTVQARQDIFLQAFRLDLSVVDHHDPVCHADDLLLVGDHDQALLFLLVDLLELVDQHGEAPEIDSSFRLIEDT